MASVVASVTQQSRQRVP